MTDSFEDIESWGENTTPTEAVADVEETEEKKGRKLVVLLAIIGAFALAAITFTAGYLLGTEEDEEVAAKESETSADETPKTVSSEESPPSLSGLADEAIAAAVVEGQPYFVAAIKDHTIEVAARVSSEAEKQELQEIVVRTYGEVTGSDSIEVDVDLEPLAWLEASRLIMGTFITENSLFGSLALTNSDAIMAMSLPREENSQRMEAALTQLGLAVDNQSEVLGHLIGPEISFSFFGEELRINGELPSQSLIDEIIADLEPSYPEIVADISVNPNRYAGYGYTFMDRNLAIVSPLDGFDIAITEGDFNITLGAAIAFDAGSSDIQPQVEEFAALFVQSPLFLVSEVFIIGHTDDVGAEESNQALSVQRAQAVADALIAQGYSAEQISVDGRGESDPVGDNDTEAGRAQNRRVELSIKT